MPDQQENDHRRARVGTDRKPRFSLPLDEATNKRLGMLSLMTGKSKAVLAEDAVKWMLQQAGV